MRGKKMLLHFSRSLSLAVAEARGTQLSMFRISGPTPPLPQGEGGEPMRARRAHFLLFADLGLAAGEQVLDIAAMSPQK